MDSLTTFDGEPIEDTAFEMLALVLFQLSEQGQDWGELIDTCLLASAFCAQEADMHPDDYMMRVRSIKVTEDGIYGDA
jgi:hypothetical protein